MRLLSFFLIVILTSFPGFAIDNCEMLKSKVARQIAAADMCEEDKDCVNIWPGCSFGCVAAVNRQAAAQLTEAAREYKNTCGDCEKPCFMGAPAPRCVDGRCTLKQR